MRDDSTLKKYDWSYKKPGGSKIKVYSVWATDENDAQTQAPREIEGGYLRYGFLGESTTR